MDTDERPSKTGEAIGPPPVAVVRHALKGEEGVLSALDKRCFPASNPAAQQAAPGDIEGGVADGGMLVATVGGAIAGLAHYSKKAPGCYFVENIAVDEVYRGRGVGTTLLAAALAEIEAVDPAAGVECTVAPANAASLALFARHGFALAGFLPAYYGPGKDRLLLEHRPALLGAGP